MTVTWLAVLLVSLNAKSGAVADQGAPGKLVGFLAGGMVGEGHSGDVADHDPSCIATTSITIISIFLLTLPDRHCRSSQNRHISGIWPLPEEVLVFVPVL